MLFLILIYFITYHLSKSASVIHFNQSIKWTLIALNIILTLPYSITYHLSKDMHVLIHFTSILIELWIALNILIALSYIHYSINDHLSRNAHIKTFFNHFTCMILA